MYYYSAPTKPDASRAPQGLLSLLSLVGEIKGRIRLTFGDESAPVGALEVRDGRVSFGIVLQDKLFVDQEFVQAAGRLALAMGGKRALEQVEPSLISRTWSLHDGHEAMGAVTARGIHALFRRLGTSDHPVRQTRIESEFDPPSLSPLELLVATARDKDKAPYDPAWRFHHYYHREAIDHWLFAKIGADPDLALPIAVHQLEARSLQDLARASGVAALVGSLAASLQDGPEAATALLIADDAAWCALTTHDRVALCCVRASQVGHCLRAAQDAIETGRA